jgi:hypothetical protein
VVTANSRVLQRSMLFLVTTLAFSNLATADLLTYRAETGQSGTAEFVFRDAAHLEIYLTDTTGNMAGSSGILTSVRMRLPDSATFLRAGSVSIGTDSSSSGFSTGIFQSGADVSGEWGVTVQGKSNRRGASNRGLSSYDQVSTLQAKGIKRFKGSNRDGKKALGGAQGGISRSAAPGMGVVNDSVLMRLTIDANARKRGVQGLSNQQRAAFLASLITSSVLEFGVSGAFAYPVVLEPVLGAYMAGTRNDPTLDVAVSNEESLLDAESLGIETIEVFMPLIDAMAVTESLGFGTPTEASGTALISGFGDALDSSGLSDGDLPSLDSILNPTLGLGPIPDSDFEHASQGPVTVTNPEPSSLCLLAIGALSMVGYRFTNARRSASRSSRKSSR